MTTLKNLSRILKMKTREIRRVYNDKNKLALVFLGS